MNGHIHLKPAILSHEEKHYEKRIYSGQEFSFTASDCNYLGCCLCCPECQHGLHRRLYFQCRPQSYWCTDTPAGHLGTWQNKSTRRKKTYSSIFRPQNINHRRYLLWYPALLCKQLPAVWHQIHQRW